MPIPRPINAQSSVNGYLIKKGDGTNATYVLAGTPDPYEPADSLAYFHLLARGENPALESLYQQYGFGQDGMKKITFNGATLASKIKPFATVDPANITLSEADQAAANAANASFEAFENRAQKAGWSIV